MKQSCTIPLSSLHPIRDMILGMKIDTRAQTLRYISEISEEELNWQYAEGWNTISALLQHISACDRWFMIRVLEERDLTDIELAAYNPALEMGEYIVSLSNKSLVDILSLLDSSFNDFQKVLTEKEEDFFSKIYGQYTEETDNAWVLFHDIEDEVHHRGQISLIQKLYKESHSKK
jgi:uncharacterized damage-inducible protein DinB